MEAALFAVDKNGESEKCFVKGDISLLRESYPGLNPLLGPSLVGPATVVGARAESQPEQTGTFILDKKRMSELNHVCRSKSLGPTQTKSSQFSCSSYSWQQNAIESSRFLHLLWLEAEPKTRFVSGLGIGSARLNTRWQRKLGPQYYPRARQSTTAVHPADDFLKIEFKISS